ncbi:MAG: hypothetical protein GDA56_22290 [Hormoscilla sp. GM7CHS1pb]|nr:hypothetical protein [Hormoscilla sp. GM7CHS1pb]
MISNGSFDSYVVKFDSEGKLVRAYDFGNTEILLPDKGIGIATDSNDNAWVLGGFHGSIDIDGDGKDDLTSSDSYGSHYLAKFNSEGDFVQALEIHGRYTDHTESGKSIAIDSKDNVWTKGSFYYHLDIDGDGEDDLTNNAVLEWSR